MVVKIVRKRTAHLEKYIRTLAAKKKKKKEDNKKMQEELQVAQEETWKRWGKKIAFGLVRYG